VYIISIRVLLLAHLKAQIRITNRTQKTICIILRKRVSVSFSAISTQNEVVRAVSEESALEKVAATTPTTKHIETNIPK